MRRLFVLGVIVTAGITVAGNAQQPPAAPAGQAPAAGRGPAPVVGAIQKVAENLFMIPGAGGNTAVYVTGTGVVLVDTKNPNNGQGILDQVKTVTDRPISHIINTHAHGDHNGSNVFFPPTVEIVTHENTTAHMQKMPAFQDAANKHGLPDRATPNRMTLSHRQRLDRSVLLRPCPHQRRLPRRLPQPARDAFRRHVRARASTFIDRATGGAASRIRHDRQGGGANQEFDRVIPATAR